MSRPVILFMLNCFWPGNDASGPNQSFIALASALQQEFDFRIITRDREFGAPTSSAPTDWVDLGYAKARYLSCGLLGARGLPGLIRTIPHDLLWINSMYDREFSLPTLVARAFRASRAPVLMSPRGEFGAGALNVKPTKKKVFLSVVRALDLWRGLTIHATSEAEARDIAAGAPRGSRIVVAPNLRLMLAPPPFTSPGEALRVVFVGRIVPIKGLDFALAALSQVKSKVEFEIFGPEEDPGATARCRELAQRLPPNVAVHWRGAASNEAVVAAHARSDLFLLPTGGENFGHAIFEALSCGVPALISDRTPWRQLEAARAGWDLPLDDPADFSAAIDRYAALPGQARLGWREGARAAARRWVETSGAREANARMLHGLVARKPAT